MVWDGRESLPGVPEEDMAALSEQAQHARTGGRQTAGYGSQVSRVDRSTGPAPSTHHSVRRNVNYSSASASQARYASRREHIPAQWDEDDGYGHSYEPRLIEAPVRVQVRTVARISPDPRLWLLTKPESTPAEQFRVLALKLREERGARVVAVAAATREGQSHTASVNLALAFSEGNQTRVALVDADLRGSNTNHLFDLQEGPALGEQIRHHRKNPQQNWTVLGLTSGLHLVPAGRGEKNPSSLLNSELMSDMMQEFRRYFDFIVIAAPPVMESADVNILQEHVDGVVLVVRAGVTRRDSVASAITRLGEGRFMGAVLTETKQ
jgi:capsular exopolysaccharide synthesis family protein